MIKINLLGEEPVADPSRYALPVVYVLSIILTCIICAWLYSSASSDLAQVAEQNIDLQSKLNGLQEKTKEVKDLEKKRRGLADKLVIIAKLKKSKNGPVRVLDDLNTALPEKAWITDLKENAGLIRLTGLALDPQTVSDFMRTLEASDYFENVDLVETTQAEKQGVKISNFAIQSKISYTGKIKVPEPTEAKKEEVKDKPAPSAKAPAKTAGGEE